MKLKELMELYKLSMNYSRDRELARKNADAKVLCWMVANDEGRRIRAHAYIFRSERKLMGVVNRVRVEPKIALNIVRTMSVQREDLVDDVTEKEIVADSI